MFEFCIEMLYLYVYFNHINFTIMNDSVYKIIEIVGTSEISWEDAAAKAVERAASTLEDLRVAEVTQQDLKIENGKVVAYRTRVKISFKFRGN